MNKTLSTAAVSVLAVIGITACLFGMAITGYVIATDLAKPWDPLTAEEREAWNLLHFGPLLEGEANQGAFTGPPTAATEGECANALAASYLAKGLGYDVRVQRTSVLDINLTVDDELLGADWAWIKAQALHYYGVRINLGPDGISVIKRNVTTFDIAQMGVSVEPIREKAPANEQGRVDTNQVGYVKDGKVTKFGSVHRIVIFDPPAETVPFVILHEFGHALGLNHVRNEGNIMYGSTTGGYQLGLHDCSRLILSHLYKVGA